MKDAEETLIEKYAVAYFHLSTALKEARQSLWMSQIAMDTESRKIVREMCEEYDRLLVRMDSLVKP